MTKTLKAFRQGDVRGFYPDDIDSEFALNFAHAIAHNFSLNGTVAVGHDARDSSGELHQALIEGLLASGLNVIDLGLCATELGYFASSVDEISAAVVVTASHNPPAYNGFKLVLKNGQPVTFDTGLQQVMSLMLTSHRNSVRRGQILQRDIQGAYLKFLRELIQPLNIDGLIALNGLNGSAATLALDLADQFNLPVEWVRQQPGPIPAEGADPTMPRLRAEMQAFMQKHPFTMGVAWDGDCDRCVFFDGDGNMVPTYYVIGLLAQHHLIKQPGASIVFDTKLCWNTLDLIREHGGNPVPSETGHAFMKQHMRRSQAAYGGELSSHHFFGDFLACDSGMIAWLKTLTILSERGEQLGEAIASRRQKICCTPEINMKLGDVDAAFQTLEQYYSQRADSVKHFDGTSFDMPGNWRFSLCRSKTETLVRLNMESRSSGDALLNEGEQILHLLTPFKADDKNWRESLVIQ